MQKQATVVALWQREALQENDDDDHDNNNADEDDDDDDAKQCADTQGCLPPDPIHVPCPGISMVATIGNDTSNVYSSGARTG